MLTADTIMPLWENIKVSALFAGSHIFTIIGRAMEAFVHNKAR